MSTLLEIFGGMIGSILVIIGRIRRLIELFKSSLDVVDIDVLILEATFDASALDTNPDVNDDDDDDDNNVLEPLKVGSGSSPSSSITGQIKSMQRYQERFDKYNIVI
jgi:hypothetical protein